MSNHSLQKNLLIGLLFAGLSLLIFVILGGALRNTHFTALQKATIVPTIISTGTNPVSLPTITQTILPTKTIPIPAVTITPTATPSFYTGQYDFNNDVVYSDSQDRLEPINEWTDIDPRLSKVLNPSIKTITWLPNENKTFEKDGVTFTRIYRSSDGDAIKSMTEDERMKYAAYIDATKIIPIHSPSETEKLFFNHIQEDNKNYNSFGFLGKVSNKNSQVEITGMVISDPLSKNHTITVNGHTINYVDFLIYIPGRGLVKQGLAMGVDGELTPDKQLVQKMFRGTFTYSGVGGRNRNKNGFVMMAAIMTKFIFASENSSDYSVAYERSQWYKFIDSYGMPMMEFAAPAGYKGLDPAKESIKYLPYLPKNYYEDFLKSGGESFVVFFPGTDIAFGLIPDGQYFFNDTELAIIRTEWDVNGNKLK